MGAQLSSGILGLIIALSGELRPCDLQRLISDNTASIKNIIRIILASIKFSRYALVSAAKSIDLSIPGGNRRLAVSCLLELKLFKIHY